MTVAAPFIRYIGAGPSHSRQSAPIPRQDTTVSHLIDVMNRARRFSLAESARAVDMWSLESAIGENQYSLLPDKYGL